MSAVVCGGGVGTLKVIARGEGAAWGWKGGASGGVQCEAMDEEEERGAGGGCW